MATVILEFEEWCLLGCYAVWLRRLLVTADPIPNSLSLVTLMKEAVRPSETSVITRATQRNIPEDTIVRSHRRENLKSYILDFVPFQLHR
jgi:hypothetical protein